MKNPLKSLFYKKIQHELDGCERVLDVGCGKSSVLERLQKRFYAVGVDGFEPNIAESKLKGAHDEYILSDVTKLTLPEKSFDGIISFELIEHLEKSEGAALLKNMERWAKKKIIITTPNGFVSQKGNENALEEHKSGWTVEDFEALGFHVRGLQGFRSLARNNNHFVNALWKASYPVVYFFPSTSWRLLAIKDIIV